MKYFFSIFFSLSYICSYSQFSSGYGAPRISTGNNMATMANTDVFVTSRAVDVSAFDRITGSPFLSPEARKAFIKLTTGEKFSNVLVRFNVYNNEILLDNGKQFLALMNIDSVAYNEILPSGNSQSVILKTGYPAINKNTAASVYQVLTSKNNIQLLKYYKLKIEKVKTMGMPDKDAFITTADYYLFNSASKAMEQVKLNKKSVLNTLVIINGALENTQKLVGNFRSERDLINLINAL